MTEIEQQTEHLEPEPTSADDALTAALGYRFREPARLLEALTHKSYTNEHPEAGPDNQRLEFLGDAVLGLVVAEALMERLPNAPEGTLTPRRAVLVNEGRLAQFARQIGLGDHIRLGKGEEKNAGRQRVSILADAVEAVIGAVYLDGGYAEARLVTLLWIDEALEDAVGSEVFADAKTVLQEALQAKGLRNPLYRVVSEEGPDHAKVFEVEIVVDDTALAAGRGPSKKEAEKDAARRALEAVETLR